MPQSRRATFGLALAAFALSAAGAGVRAEAAPDCPQAALVYVGGDDGQLRAMRLDACAPKLTALGPPTDVPRPRWAVAHPHLPMLYVASDGGAKEGSVVAFAVDRESGALTRVNEIGAGGSGTTYLWLDQPSTTLLAANFGSGSTSSIKLRPDGSLGSLVSVIQATGSGPHRRQASAHAHGVAVDPTGRYALVSDLGADRVFVYAFDRATRRLTAEDSNDPRAFVAPPGSGPRHLAFGSTGRVVYLLDELTAELMALRWDARQGRPSLLQSVSISRAEFQGTKSASEIIVSADGRFVYVGDRGENTLVVYRVNGDSGELSLVQRTSSGAEMPSSFAIDPSGRWLLVANQRGNKVNLFRIDTESGKVSDTGQSIDSPAPLSVTFVK